MTAQHDPEIRSGADVAALVVTYFPDPAFAERMATLQKQLSRIVIVDNGSDATTLAVVEKVSLHPDVTLLRNDENLGIATALNQGINYLAEEGFEWIITFDQDSTVDTGFVEAIVARLNDDDDPESVAMVGCNRTDQGNISPQRWLRPKRIPIFFERVGCEQIGSEGVTQVITSGTLTKVSLHQKLGGFRDDFFIDCVDFEYCLRVKDSGKRILVAKLARLFHVVGEKQQVRRFGVLFSPLNHSALRYFYIFRNSVLMIRIYRFRYPHLPFYILGGLAVSISRIILFEEHKKKKLKSVFKGLASGFTMAAKGR